MKKYIVENALIAEINDDGEIYAKQIGTTTLWMEMTYLVNGQTQILASRSIQIRVEFITSIDIPVMNEWSLFIPSVTRLNVLYKF